MIPVEIQAEFGEQLAQLESAGYRVVRAEFDAAAFGNWFVDMTGREQLRVVKDRGQYFAEADRASLEEFGLWRAFDSLEEFVAQLLVWARRGRTET